MAQKACSLPRTKWMRRRRVVFAPKCRRKAICNQIRSDPGEIFGKLCRCKGIGIVEGHLMPDRVHMLPAMPPKCSVSSVMGYLEGEGPADDVRQAREHEVKVRQQEVPGRGHCAPAVGLNEAAIAKRIRGQEKAGIALDRLSVKEHEDPFGRGPGRR